MKRYNKKKNIRWNTMSDSIDFDTDWRTWNHCLCNGILFSLTQTDYCQGAYGYPGNV